MPMRPPRAAELSCDYFADTPPPLIAPTLAARWLSCRLRRFVSIFRAFISSLSFFRLFIFAAITDRKITQQMSKQGLSLQPISHSL